MERPQEQYLRKGSKVYIEGALQTRKWQDQSGQDKYSTEVVLQGYGGVTLAAAVAATVVGPRLGTQVAVVAALIWMTKSRSKKNPGGRVADLTTANTL